MATLIALAAGAPSALVSGTKRLRGGILDDHRTGGQDRISGLRTGPFDRRAPRQSIVPADARPEQECLAVRQHLGDIAIFDPQAAGDAGGRVVQQIGQW